MPHVTLHHRRLQRLNAFKTLTSAPTWSDKQTSAQRYNDTSLLLHPVLFWELLQVLSPDTQACSKWKPHSCICTASGCHSGWVHKSPYGLKVLQTSLFLSCERLWECVGEGGEYFRSVRSAVPEEEKVDVFSQQKEDQSLSSPLLFFPVNSARRQQSRTENWTFSWRHLMKLFNTD